MLNVKNICKQRTRRINEGRKRFEMQRILLLILLFAQVAPCNANLEAQLETLLEDASFLLHNLSRQHLAWQCNAREAPPNTRRLASCQQAAHAKSVVLKLPTIELLAELLEQLPVPKNLYDEVFQLFVRFV